MHRPDMEYPVVIFNGEPVELEVSVDDGFAFIEDVMESDTITPAEARQLMEDHWQELQDLANKKIDEVRATRRRNKISPLGQRLMNDAACLTKIMYGV